jgi:thiol:disulfide interchange protein
VTAELNIHIEDAVSTKTVQRDFHKSNIYGWAAIAKPLITASNAQTCKQGCHDHKTSMSDNWKCMHYRVKWDILHSVPCFTKSLHLENTQGSLQSGMPGFHSETWGKFSDGLGVNVMACCLPLLPFMAELLQGSRWTGSVIRCIPSFRHYF